MTRPPEPPRQGPPRRLPRRWGILLFVLLGLFAYRWLGNRTGPEHPKPPPPFSVAFPEAPAAAPGSAAAPAAAGARDLARDERAGGHALERHVGRSDDELARRLERERSINAASTFTDRPTAERVVGATLEREAARIAAWLARRGDDLALDYRGEPGAPVGRVLVRGERAPRPAADARVVLRRSGGSYFVLTAYPLE